MLDEPALKIKTTPLTAWLPLMSQATNHLFPPSFFIADLIDDDAPS